MSCLINKLKKFLPACRIMSVKSDTKEVMLNAAEGIDDRPN